MLNFYSTVIDIVKYLKASSSPKQSERVRSRGIELEHVIGAPKKFVQSAAKALGKNHELAIDLWTTEFHECRLLAILIADPERMDFALQKDWVNSIWSWDLCDHFCRYLLPYIPNYTKLIAYCTCQQKLYVKRVAFAGMACSLIHRDDIDEEQIEEYLSYITKAAFDGRHHVRKAVVWALVEIGKCSSGRQETAIIHAAELMEGDKAQQWVGRNALKELELLVEVQERGRLLTSKSKTGSKTIGKYYSQQ